MAELYIKLTRVSVEYTVSAINNRDSRLISKKISLCSSFLFIRGLCGICLCSTLLNFSKDEYD
jgi:hypothetical protein